LRLAAAAPRPHGTGVCLRDRPGGLLRALWRGRACCWAARRATRWPWGCSCVLVS